MVRVYRVATQISGTTNFRPVLSVMLNILVGLFWGAPFLSHSDSSIYI